MSRVETIEKTLNELDGLDELQRKRQNGLWLDLSGRVVARGCRLGLFVQFVEFVQCRFNCCPCTPSNGLGARAILSAASLALRSPQDDRKGPSPALRYRQGLPLTLRPPQDDRKGPSLALHLSSDRERSTAYT